jgi:integrase
MTEPQASKHISPVFRACYASRNVTCHLKLKHPNTLSLGINCCKSVLLCRTMTISQHKENGLWYFTIPAKMSDTGKRKPMYYPTKHKAEDGLADFQREYRKYRGSTLSEKDHGVMAVIKAKYADLNVIAVLEEYKRTHGNLKPISVRDATEAFIKRIQASTLADDTKSGYRSRLRQFSAFIGDLQLHEVTASHIDKFLQTKKEGGDRKSHWKGLSPFFTHALSPAHWIVRNPMEDFSKEQKPQWGKPKREIYTPDQYAKLLATASSDEYVTRYLVLAGMGFFRPEELIKASPTAEVLHWEDIQLDRELIHVRAEVAKGTGRRGGDARYVNLKENETLLKWLRQEMSLHQLSGPIIPFSQDHFRSTRLNRVHATAGIKPLPDGMRHSAISYYLAMNEGTTIRQVAEWAGNTEAIILGYYLQYLRPEQGKKWFHVIDQLIKG